MKKSWSGLLALPALALTASSTALAADATVTVNDYPVTLGFSGFVRADYGNGDRYSAADGEDRLGFTKSLLLLSATTEDIKVILDFGGTGLSQANGGSDIGIKDAFIIIGYDKPLSFSAGAQPLLFGLKPNGYPSDSSLQANVDYGGGGAFAVSQQAGPSLIGTYKFDPDLSVRFGAFDLAESNTGNTTTATNGSKITHNLFVLLRGGNILGTGLYGTVGAEEIYVGLRGGPLGTQGNGPVGGAMIDKSKAIYSAGVGFKKDIVDVSIELIGLNSAIVNTGDNERYVRFHGAVQPIQDWTFYADYSNAHELGLNDYRIGATWQFRHHLALTGEYSRDNYKSNNELYDPTTNLYGVGYRPDVQSVDVRLTFTF
jgi:hypothetical protein